MNIIISGFGRMGKLINDMALSRKHNVIAILDKEDDWCDHKTLKKADVIIDFSMPGATVKNIEKCFSLEIPIVVGTTGWYDKLDYVKDLCVSKKQSLFYAPNFSIGVNIFFELNKYLAQLMTKQCAYNVHIKEAHHITKLDAPSGTAIKLADDIIDILPTKDNWTNFASLNSSELQIISERKDNIIGKHEVIYASDEDEIKIEHIAGSRKGFAMGAVMAAEWLAGKKGIFEMKDMLSVGST
jgi:4-hydroxy-tetrahydrodipicolinate reductase